MEPQAEIYLNSDEFKNPDLDVEIKNFFTSTQLDRKFLRFALNGEFFNVLLIHNPKKLKLKSVINFNTSKHGLVNATLKYNKKIGIFFDRKAPRKLIKHISKLIHLSWWNRLRNVRISNGSKYCVQYTTSKMGFNTIKYKTTTYYPCSTYTAMKNATP